MALVATPIAVTAATLSGNVFEDVTFAGGVGRNKTASSGVNRSGVRVELYTAAGNYSTFATTDASGNYSFAGLTSTTNYTIRVVNSTVTSSLGGTSLIPVQTYRTTATAATATAVTDYVGGQDPDKADSGNGSTTLGALTAGSLLPQSITACTTNTGTKSGIDFGFNFNTIVNANNTGQGSLRQMITNSSGMSGTQTSIFMITDGSAHAGLRAGLANQLTSGVAVITLTTELPTPTGAIIYDGTTQTANIGDTNSGTLGTGGTVGVDGLTLSTVNRPEVELVGSSGLGSGILMGQNNSTLKGFAIHGFGTGIGQGDVVVGGTGLTITQNVIGTTATSFSLPGSAQTGGSALRVNPATGTISNNLFGYTAYCGILFYAGANTLTISNNEFRGCGRSGNTGGMLLAGTGHAISQNLFAANKGNGIDVDGTASASSAQSMVNNTFTGNGVGTVGTRSLAAIRLFGNTNVIDRNIITGSYGPGVMITSGSTANKFTRNSIYSNGTITNDSAQAATGQVGIDLLSATDIVSTGTAPYYTINDNTDADTGGNNRLNFPVLATAVINGSNLTVTGWARPGSVIEFFISDSDPSGFGEGQTYLTSFTEGGGSDTDATTGSYSNPVNGLNQGTDNTNRFSFTFALPGGVSAGTKLTATATDASNNTSEFSGVVTVTLGTITLSGNVFEDVTYAGGAGRTKAAAAGVSRSGARVEVYTAAGAYSTFTTTDVAGDYALNVTPSATHTLRVVNSTVTSSLGGTSLIPVQTYRTTATTGSAVAVADRVGGEDPTKADAGNGATTLGALTAGSLMPQSITSVTAATSAITGLDFGFNFNTVVNKNDTAQGSLRQVITNANGMSGTQAGMFMISDGNAHAGLRAGITNQLTSGVAVITLASLLPQITGPVTLDATSQTTNVGDTNAGTLGAGGTVGVDGLTLPTVNRPEVEIIVSSLSVGLDIAAANSTVKGFAIHGAGGNNNYADISVTGANGVTVTQNVIGATATTFALPATHRSDGVGLRFTGTITSGTATNNLVGFTNYPGLPLATTTSGLMISQNEIRGCGRAGATFGGIDVLGLSHTISGNLFPANKGQAIDVWQVGQNSHTIVNNTVTGNGVGTTGSRENSGVRLISNHNTLDRNIIALNYGAGVTVIASATGNKITRNSIYGNGTITNDSAEAATGNIGIDLQGASDNQAIGTAPYYTLNDSGDSDAGGNNLINTPVIDTATIIGSNLELAGWVRGSGTTIEFFIANADGSNFGEGEIYIATLVEGSGSDTDATTGSYSANVNCYAQGADSSVVRFKYTFAKPVAVVLGTQITATATDASSNTSEFSGNATVYDNFPDFTVVKSSQTISDPLNATTNPKAIPGGIVQYTIVVTNTDPARTDPDTFELVNAIAAGTQLYVADIGGAGSGPVLFAEGATSSQLTYTFSSLVSALDSLSFSSDGGATWTYAPSLDGNGCDVNVTHIRIRPTGMFARAACGINPSCQFQYRVRVQ